MLHLCIVLFLFQLVNSRPAQVADQEQAISELQIWFEKHYHPEFLYDQDGSFMTGNSDCFSPYHIIPLWDKAVYRIDKTSRGKTVKTWSIPILTERSMNISFWVQEGDQISKRSNRNKPDILLMIREEGKRKTATIRVACQNNQQQENGPVLFEALVNMNSGDSEMVAYYEHGQVLYYYDYSGVGQFGMMNYPRDLWNGIGGHNYTYYDTYGDALILYVSPSIAHTKLTNIRNYRRDAKFNLKDGNKRFYWEVKSERTPGFPNMVVASRADGFPFR